MPLRPGSLKGYNINSFDLLMNTDPDKLQEYKNLCFFIKEIILSFK